MKIVNNMINSGNIISFLRVNVPYSVCSVIFVFKNRDPCIHFFKFSLHVKRFLKFSDLITIPFNLEHLIF